MDVSDELWRRLRREANRRSYEAVPETCPEIDAAIQELVSFVEGEREIDLALRSKAAEINDRIKAQTALFRKALGSALLRALTAETNKSFIEYPLA